MTGIIVYLLACYLAGSIPFGLIFGKMAGHDVRNEGSHNIGFTNVLRVCGAKWGFPVLLLDIFKGFAPVFWLAPLLLDQNAADYHLQQTLGALMALLGHSFPVWLRFRGGKGVATGAGVMAALVPWPLIIGAGSWLIIVAISRYVSLGSLLGSIVALVAQICLTWGECWSAKNAPGMVLILAIVALLWIRHRSNIGRLLNGTENKISLHKKENA